MKKIGVGDFRFGEEERAILKEVVDSNRISEARKVEEFEKEFASYIGVKNCIAVSSGSSALICSLSAMKGFKDLRKRLKVITTPLTYVATINSVTTSNFEPVFVDVNKDDFCIDPENIKIHLEKVNKNEYSIILPVHLMGYPCDMSAINKIAKDNNLLVLEDAAQAHGSIYKNKKAGSLGLMGVFSFYVSHSIPAGEMGAITTDNKEITKIVRLLKDHGRIPGDKDFIHHIIGFNFKTTEFCAAIALSQVRKADKIINKRQQNVKYLNDGLERFSDTIKLPMFSENIGYLAYPIVAKKIKREKLMLELEKRNIETRPLFGCVPTQQPAYSYLKKQYEGKLPNAEYLGKNALYIGCHQYLKQEELDYVIKAFKEILS